MVRIVLAKMLFGLGPFVGLIHHPDIDPIADLWYVCVHFLLQNIREVALGQLAGHWLQSGRQAGFVSTRGAYILWFCGTLHICTGWGIKRGVSRGESRQ